jgi:hypothetical protein
MNVSSTRSWASDVVYPGQRSGGERDSHLWAARELMTEQLSHSLRAGRRRARCEFLWTTMGPGMPDLLPDLGGCWGIRPAARRGHKKLPRASAEQIPRASSLSDTQSRAMLPDTTGDDGPFLGLMNRLHLVRPTQPTKGASCTPLSGSAAIARLHSSTARRLRLEPGQSACSELTRGESRLC